MSKNCVEMSDERAIMIAISEKKTSKSILYALYWNWKLQLRPERWFGKVVTKVWKSFAGLTNWNTFDISSGFMWIYWKDSKWQYTMTRDKLTTAAFHHSKSCWVWKYKETKFNVFCTNMYVQCIKLYWYKSTLLLEPVPSWKTEWQKLGCAAKLKQCRKSPTFRIWVWKRSRMCCWARFMPKFQMRKINLRNI